jgi:hypothetical protein
MNEFKPPKLLRVTATTADSVDLIEIWKTRKMVVAFLRHAGCRFWYGQYECRMSSFSIRYLLCTATITRDIINQLGHIAGAKFIA